LIKCKKVHSDSFRFDTSIVQCQGSCFFLNTVYVGPIDDKSCGRPSDLYPLKLKTVLQVIKTNSFLQATKFWVKPRNFPLAAEFRYFQRL